MQPRILQEWQKHPVMRKIAVQKINLAHKTGNEYTGSVVCALNGHIMQIGIDVTVEKNANVVWKLRPGEEGLPVREMEFNGAQVFVTFPVTEQVAKRFGNCLVHEGVFDGEPYACRLSKSGSAYEIHLAVKAEIEDDDEAQEMFRKLGAEMSMHVFDSAPVVIHLCDSSLTPLKASLSDKAES